MNKRKLLATLLLFFSLTGIAQPTETESKMKIDEERFLRFGIKLGANIHKLPGQSYGKGFAYNYQIGGFAQINFSERFGIQPEFNWAQSMGEKTNDVATIYDDITGTGSQIATTFNYLEIPVLLNVNVGVSKHVKIQVGPSYGLLLSNKTEKAGERFELYTKNEVAMVTGFWLQLPFVYLGGRYKYGLTNHTNILSGEKWKNQSIQIFVGATF